jgi:hypothetical protein
VLAMGMAGRAVLISVDESTLASQRLYKPPHGKRPGKCVERSDQSSAVPLLTRGGELMVVGGCTSDPETLQSIDIYNVRADNWSRVHTGVKRAVPATVLLPDGTVLIVSGENLEINQMERGDAPYPMDPRRPQIFDPETMTVFTELTEQLDVFRGYHNTASLLHDGRVLVAGGFNQLGDVGCENPNLRLFRPSYLSQGPQPRLTGAATAELLLHPGDAAVSIPYDGSALHPEKGAALVAVQAFTHSYGQNQRYVRLPIRNCTASAVVVDVPPSPIVFPGQYHLFLVSREGVPSVSRNVLVRNKPRDAPASRRKGLPSWFAVAVWIGVVAAVSITSTLLICRGSSPRRVKAHSEKRPRQHRKRHGVMDQALHNVVDGSMER